LRAIGLKQDNSIYNVLGATVAYRTGGDAAGCCANIALVPDLMFPIAPLPNTAFAFFLNQWGQIKLTRDQLIKINDTDPIDSIPAILSAAPN